MARINIEHSIFNDIRFSNLIIKMGDRRLAIGHLVDAWILAQKAVGSGTVFIPIDDWNMQQISDLVLEVGLAEITQDGVYVKGTKEYFKWITDKKNAAISNGKKGGLAKASKTKQNVANPSGSSYSYSYSNSKKEEYNTPEAKPKKPRSAKADAWTKLPLLVGL